MPVFCGLKRRLWWLFLGPFRLNLFCRLLPKEFSLMQKDSIKYNTVILSPGQSQMT